MQAQIKEQYSALKKDQAVYQELKNIAVNYVPINNPEAHFGSLQINNENMSITLASFDIGNVELVNEMKNFFTETMAADKEKADKVLSEIERGLKHLDSVNQRLTEIENKSKSLMKANTGSMLPSLPSFPDTCKDLLTMAHFMQDFALWRQLIEEIPETRKFYQKRQSEIKAYFEKCDTVRKQYQVEQMPPSYLETAEKLNAELKSIEDKFKDFTESKSWKEQLPAIRNIIINETNRLFKFKQKTTESSSRLTSIIGYCTGIKTMNRVPSAFNFLDQLENCYRRMNDLFQNDIENANMRLQQVAAVIAEYNDYLDFVNQKFTKDKGDCWLQLDTVNNKVEEVNYRSRFKQKVQNLLDHLAFTPTSDEQSFIKKLNETLKSENPYNEIIKYLEGLNESKGGEHFPRISGNLLNLKKQLVPLLKERNWYYKSEQGQSENQTNPSKQVGLFN